MKEDKISIEHFSFVDIHAIQMPDPRLFCIHLERLSSSRTEGTTGWFEVSHSRLETTLNEAPDSSDGPGVRLVFSSVYEGDEARGVQTALRLRRTVIHTGLQPRLLQTQSGGRPSAGLGPQEEADEIPGCLADAVEVVAGEAEVQPADVQAGLLGALVQEGRCSAQ